MQKRIAQFLKKKYTVTLSTVDQDQPWAFACYYAFDEEQFRLIYVTNDHTKHAKLIGANPKVSGTIFTPTRFHLSLQGAQFVGESRELKGKEADKARAIYKKEYNHELADQLSIWEVKLNFVRLVDNSLGLYGKMEWTRGLPVKELPPVI